MWTTPSVFGLLLYAACMWTFGVYFTEILVLRCFSISDGVCHWWNYSYQVKVYNI